MKKPLQYFRYRSTRIIAQLENQKYIMRETTARLYVWWLVIPATGEKDAQCIRIHSISRRATLPIVESALLKQYQPRLVKIGSLS